MRACVRAAGKTPCERLMSKGGLSPGSSVSLPGRDSVPALNAKTLYPGRMLCSLPPPTSFLIS